MSILNSLSDNQGARTARTRVGRGIGSGKGKTSGRGIKGQKSRSGVAVKGFEGGQMPIFRRLPKRGFNNFNRKENEALNLSTLQKFIDAKKLDVKKTITVELLVEAGVIRGTKDAVKLLNKGELKAAVTLEVHKASEAAIKAVEKAGGKVTLVEAKQQNTSSAGDSDEKKVAAKKAAPKKTAAKKSPKKDAK